MYLKGYMSLYDVIEAHVSAYSPAGLAGISWRVCFATGSKLYHYYAFHN
jgi:hypothetical protein